MFLLEDRDKEVYLSKSCHKNLVLVKNNKFHETVPSYTEIVNVVKSIYGWLATLLV